MRRLSRLSGYRGYFRVLAMDHGLTVGLTGGAPTNNASNLCAKCAEHLDGVVLNYGLARSLESIHRTPNLILQCFGAPAENLKVNVAPVDTALRMDAAAVSVQLDFGRDDLPEHTREIAKFTHEAHNKGMPVMFMTSGFNTSSALDVANVVRVCQELGADLIKTSLSKEVLLSPQDVQMISEACQDAPPVLLAGGEADTGFPDKLDAALNAGFSGYCVGRSVFQASDPGATAETLSQLVQAKYERS